MERTPQKIFLFRAVQELLFNIIMHAGGKEANVEVTPVAPIPLTAETVAIDMGLKTTRVLIVDDHKIMRQGLINLVKIESKIDVVGEASNGLEALEKARNIKPDVILRWMASR
jgi:PleD family two-component response regulator